MNMGERIKDLRVKRKMTQVELATLIDVANTTLSGYENNYTQPDIATLRKIANILGTSMDYLAGNTNIPDLPLKETIVEIKGKKLKIIHAATKTGLSDNTIITMLNDIAKHVNKDDQKPVKEPVTKKKSKPTTKRKKE